MVRGLPFRVGADPSVAELVTATPMSVLQRSFGVRSADDKCLSRALVGVTMGSTVRGSARSPFSQERLLGHLSITAWVRKSQVPRLGSAGCRWQVGISNIDGPALRYSIRSGGEFTEHTWRCLSLVGSDDLLVCSSMVGLSFTDVRADLSSTVHCTDASETGAGACPSTSLSEWLGGRSVFSDECLGEETMKRRVNFRQRCTQN